ncbi:hypothetical protein BKA24_001656 [Microbacterium marinum]|uniref:Uncharacterized protein n=1 Tax=Microbacterium marinum TaxID=421115 RepID=A0A7W7BQI1_9MICO|nr:hypothetical protein [Microbacterium marinum]MBB4666947.1 hypothetical protein [Microbacterium marinum]
MGDTRRASVDGRDERVRRAVASQRRAERDERFHDRRELRRSRNVTNELAEVEG